MTLYILIGILGIPLSFLCHLILYENYWKQKLFTRISLVIIILLLYALGLIFLAQQNPCIEYATDCDIICTGEGTPAYECWEECPCIERKN